MAGGLSVGLNLNSKFQIQTTLTIHFGILLVIIIHKSELFLFSFYCCCD